MRFFLDLIYALLIGLTSPWLVYAAVRHGKYREGLGQKLFGLVPRRDGDRPCVWLHAVSVGEVNLLDTMLREIQQKHPGWQCVISTTTKTGMEVARRKYSDHVVFYCPLDFSWAVRRAMRRIRPSLLLLAELELWPNLIHAAKARAAHVAVMNGRLSESSFRGYRRIRWIIGPLLQKLDLIAVQDQSYGDRFTALGAPSDRVVVTGSLKYDGAQTDRKNDKTQELAALAGFEQSDIVFLAGSTQAPEETMALEAYCQLAEQFPALRLVLVPRHPERFDAVARLLDESGVCWQRRSAMQPEACLAESRVLLVDTVGELGAWWGTAQIAFVGGSMGDRGGQNMIEPAALGASVCFGPNTRNFRDVVTNLMRKGAAVVVRDQQELTQFVRRSIESPAFASNLGQRAQQFVISQLGATQRTLEGIDERGLVPTSPARVEPTAENLVRDAA